MRLLLVMLVLAVIAVAAGLSATAPAAVDEAAWQDLPEPNLDNGERIFWMSGCASCHAAPQAEGEAQLVLSGGLALQTDFGTFRAPNISPHPEAGIGTWSLAEFGHAMQQGVGPGGYHLYPAFPYTSYVNMRRDDIADLWAFMGTLPQSGVPSEPHDLGFPFNIRRAVGIWKSLNLKAGARIDLRAPDETALVGQYIVEGPGHCGECHTPRGRLGGLDVGRWLAGAENPEGEGVIPNITPGEGGIGDWSAADIAYYLESGFTPEFDTVGGSMAAVQRNMARLPTADREAIAAYLKAVPARPRGYDRE